MFKYTLLSLLVINIKIVFLIYNIVFKFYLKYLKINFYAYDNKNKWSIINVGKRGQIKLNKLVFIVF